MICAIGYNSEVALGVGCLAVSSKTFARKIIGYWRMGLRMEGVPEATVERDAVDRIVRELRTAPKKIFPFKVESPVNFFV